MHATNGTVNIRGCAGSGRRAGTPTRWLWRAISRLDAVQTRFLRDFGVDEVTTRINFRLAPLLSRRDMAMLGAIHRTMLGKGPVQFREFFPT